MPRSVTHQPHAGRAAADAIPLAAPAARIQHESFADEGAISLDPDRIAALKSAKDRRYHTIQVPELRLVGFFTLAAIVVAFNWSSMTAPWASVAWMAAAFLAYSLASWGILLTSYGRVPINIGNMFLAIDPFVWMGAAYLTGGVASSFYLLPLVRVADQLNTSRAQALAFTLDGVAAYGALVAYLAIVDGVTVSWPLHVGRALVIAGTGSYLALTAGTAERLRARLAEAVRRARESIRQLQEQSVLLEDARKRAEAASRAKSQFLANVSHEFRTPLNAIVGYAELLDEEMPSAPQSVHEDLGRISRSAQHLRDLVNDLIELSRMEAGRFTLDIKPVDIQALVADVASVVMPLVRTNNNVFDIVGAAGAGILVADALKVRQILVNAIDNASKFTTSGRITLACAREASDGREYIVFRVSDTGIGMDAEQLARVLKFEPFVQADSSITRRFGGTGLGLTISQRLCRLMGGSLTIESAPAVGTTVTCRLPAVVTPLVDR
jgi:signal transduction histidine kinase